MSTPGHALRNAVLPIVTIVGIEAAFLVGGLIVTETVFNIPGVARFLVEAIRWRDYPIVQNLVMFIAVVRRVDQLPDRHGLRSRSIRASPTRKIAWPRSTAPTDRDHACAQAGSAALGFYVPRYPPGAAGAVIVESALVLMAIFAPWITQFDPTMDQPALPLLATPLGEPRIVVIFMGRDWRSRIVDGAAHLASVVGIRPRSGTRLPVRCASIPVDVW